MTFLLFGASGGVGRRILAQERHRVSDRGTGNYGRRITAGPATVVAKSVAVFFSPIACEDDGPIPIFGNSKTPIIT